MHIHVYTNVQVMSGCKNCYYKNNIIWVHLELQKCSLFLFRDKTINNCYLFRYNVKLQTNMNPLLFAASLLNKTSWQWNNEPGCLDKEEKLLFLWNISALHAILYLLVKFLSVTKPILIRPFLSARSLVHWKTSFWTVLRPW